MEKRKIDCPVKDVVISLTDLKRLADLCYQQWVKRKEEVEHKWEKEELPQLQKEIQAHNKQVKKSKDSWAVIEYIGELIDSQKKEDYLSREKKDYLRFKNGIRDSDVSFTIILKDGQEIRTDSLTAFDELNEEEIDRIFMRFDLGGYKGGDEISIFVNQEYTLRIELSGTFEWVNQMKARIEEKIKLLPKTSAVGRWLRKFSFFVSVILTFIFDVPLYLMFRSDTLLFTLIVSLPLVAIFVWMFLETQLKKIFPTLYIGNNYNPYKKPAMVMVVGLLTFIILPLAINLLSAFIYPLLQSGD